MNHKALDRRVKRHIIASPRRVFLALQPGLEEAGEIELARMGLTGSREKEAGSLTADVKLEELWQLVITGRSFSRIYLRLDDFKAEGFAELKKKLARIPWELYIREGCEYRVKISTTRSRLHVHDRITKSLNHCLNEHFEALEGISPRFTESRESDPEIQTIIIRALDDRFTISLDAGGGALYRRGYRQNINGAPLKENIAASLLLLSGLGAEGENGITELIDPMCGSGTFSLECLSITSGLRPSPRKTYPFEYWPSFRPGRFNWLTGEIEKREKPPLKIHASDMDTKSIETAELNLTQLKGDSGREDLEWTMAESDFFTSPVPEDTKRDRALLILNPPYGRRLDIGDQTAFFRRLGERIKTEYKGILWGIIVPGMECEKALGLKWEKKYLFKNGGFPVSFLIGRS
ncbi:MAG: hypothetical protein PQJ50_03035 [Spirochaetales bacterium]|nr:hypothetical protein [Spirochaetales bacterium]